MRVKYLAGLVCLNVVFTIPLQGKDVPKEFKQKLFDRYDQKQVVCVPGGMVVGLAQRERAFGVGTADFGVRYTHFHESVEIPRRVRNEESIDDRTFASVSAEPDSIRRIGPAERLLISKMYLHGKSIELELMPISATSLGRSARTAGEVRRYGLEFAFNFPPTVMESGDYDTIVREINKYLLPADEYKEKAEAAKKIEIQPGMSKDEVIKSMGEPLKTLVFGKKTILKYADVTIELEDDKVTELKAN
jgi:hypothetical protein